MSQRPRRGRNSPRAGDRPDYKLYRARPRFLGGSTRDREARVDAVATLRKDLRKPGGPAGPRRFPRVRPKRVLIGVLIGLAGWLLLSLILFIVSAQIHDGNEPDNVKSALKSAGPMPFSANTILVLGSDARPPHSKEPGANPNGPHRSDTMMLIRAGGGKSARLSIPRDTVVNIPGHGMAKINAAYAFGGPALAITTVEQFLGIDINHVIEINFVNLPKFVDDMGGITYSGKCVVSDISGGTANGGFSLHLRAGTHHLDGRQTLTLARTRHNQCNPAENDIQRVERQQKIINAIKAQLTSPHTFLHLPWVAWDAPQTLKTDMGGPTLLGLSMAMAVSGSPPTRVLKPSAFVQLPDGESALQVTPDSVRAAVAEFMK